MTQRGLESGAKSEAWEILHLDRISPAFPVSLVE